MLVSVEYLLTCLIVILLPGSGVIYTIAVGVGRGYKAAVAGAIGCTFGIVPAATASVFGLAAIFHTSAIIFIAIKYLGVAYLFYMAWNTLRNDGLLSLNEVVSEKSLVRIAVEGTLLNVLNPKLSLFFLAFLPQFVPMEKAGSIGYMALLAFVFMVMTLLVFLVYGVFAAKARAYVVESPTVVMWMRRLFAGTFAFLGLRLALADR